MKKKLIISLAILVVVIVAIILLIILPVKPPIYEDKCGNRALIYNDSCPPTQVLNHYRDSVCKDEGYEKYNPEITACE
ncbi:hypothetical protein HOD88_02965 [archaeon]|jgi:hypothetical protein|nr:hypothetical protein [archaeon]